MPTSAIAIAMILIPQSASTINDTDIPTEHPMADFGPNTFYARAVKNASKSGDLRIL